MGDVAVVLLSGGLDSTTVLAFAQSEGYDVHALSFVYGQRHAVGELGLAISTAKRLGIPHRVVTLNLGGLGGSALTDASIPVPKDGADDGIPVTYVPARNTIMLAWSLAVAEVVGAADVFIGVNAVDFSGYPDCRPEFIDAFNALAQVATKAAVEGLPVKVHAPLLRMDKPSIIRLGLSLGVDYAGTISCYAPVQMLTEGGGRMLRSFVSCGLCDACRLRLAGFADVGIPDPARYSQSAG